MKAKSIQGRSPDEIRDALARLLRGNFSPTLAIVFISIKQDRNAVINILTEHGIDVFGATSSGEFIDGHQSEGEIAILLLDIPKEDYSLIFIETSEIQLEEAAEKAAKMAMSSFSSPAYIMLSTCINTKEGIFEGARVVELLDQYTEEKSDIFGGMAGADGELVPSWIFTHLQSTDEGFSLLVLDKNKIDLYGLAISGWKPLGRIRTVTKCQGGWLYEIDGQPALDMYLRYLGESMEEENGESRSFLDDISLFHPFLCLDDVDPELRTPMFIDKAKNAIMLDYPIPEGGKFQFTVPPDFDIVETVLNRAGTLQKNTQNEADALLIFSCLGRLNALGPMATQENEGLHDIWNAPMAGFFTYGEYGQDPDGKNKMHSTTCSWVALKEK